MLKRNLEAFIYGFTLPVAALDLILKKRKLLLWSILPIFLTLAFSIWGVSWIKAKLIAASMTWLLAHGYAADSVAVRAAVVFLQITLFVLAAITFSFFASLISSPFNDFLAEATEAYAEPKLPPAPAHFRGKVRALAIDIFRTTVIAALQIALLIVGLIAFWIPGLNLIPFAAAFWLLAFQFLSYPQTRRHEGFRASLRFLFRNAFATFGFGAAIGFLFALPIASAFALPLAVVGGTLLYARFR